MPGKNDIDFGDVNPAIKQYERKFRWSHLPAELQGISQAFAQLALDCVRLNPQGGPSISQGLQKLWEAKNEFVMAYATRPVE